MSGRLVLRLQLFYYHKSFGFFSRLRSRSLVFLSFILSQLRKHHTYNSKELLESVNNFIAKISFLAINFYIHVSRYRCVSCLHYIQRDPCIQNSSTDEGLTKTNYQNYQKVSSNNLRPWTQFNSEVWRWR